MIDGFSLLTVSAYAQEAARTDRGVEGQALTFPLLGLFGEVGSLLSELKKKQRDRASFRSYSEAVAEELGDVLWYLAAVARRGGFSLSTVAAHIRRRDVAWTGVDEPDLTFEALQPHPIPRTGDPTKDFEPTLLTLAAEVGALIADIQSGRAKAGEETLALHLVKVMTRLMTASREAGLTLEAAALKNRHKIFDRWPVERVYPPAFDTEIDPDEQLPRRLVVDLFEKDVGGRQFVFQRCNDLFIGDRLTDNAHEQDDYRFHDVFHFAFVAVLGWSPVIRALLRLKRKSVPRLDEAEDGARAILIEEGVSTWVFGQAARLDYFEGFRPGDLPIDLLKQIRQFVAGYEPQDLPLWLWEDAILQGYAAFRFLKENRQGRVTLDFETRSLRVEALPS